MRTRTAVIGILLALTLLAAACADDSEPLEAGSRPIDSPAQHDDRPDGDDAGGNDDVLDPAEPERVEPRSGMANVRPRGWEEASQIDESTLAIRFWSGVEPCYVLDRVEVVETDTSVTVTLYEGNDPEAGDDVFCIEIAVWKETIVELDGPLADREIIDGSSASRGY